MEARISLAGLRDRLRISMAEEADCLAFLQETDQIWWTGRTTKAEPSPSIRGGAQRSVRASRPLGGRGDAPDRGWHTRAVLICGFFCVRCRLRAYTGTPPSILQHPARYHRHVRTE